MCQIDENQINIRGYALKITDKNYYHFKNDDIELKAYKFNPGKEEFPNILNIDTCNIFLISNEFYAVFGEDCRNKEKFSL